MAWPLRSGGWNAGKLVARRCGKHGPGTGRKLHVETLESRQLLSVSVGGRVWNDTNANGLQDAGEAGVAGAVVEIFSTADGTLGNTDDISQGVAITAADGRYSFAGLADGLTFYEVVRTPVGYTFTTANVGSNDTADSDTNSSGRTGPFTVAAGQTSANWDAGLLGAAPGFGYALRAGTANYDTGQSVATDAAGNVYVTGWFQGTTDFDPGPGVTSLSAVNWEDVFVAKYTPMGALVWARGMGGSDFDWGSDIFVTADGYVYTTGWFGTGNPGLIGTADFDPGPGTYNLTTAGNYDIFISKLDTAGNFVWARSMGGTDLEQGRAITVASDGSVYTTGMFARKADFDPSNKTYFLTSAGGGDIFVSKLTAAGDFVWARAMGGTGQFDEAFDIAVDNNGNVYTTGHFLGTADFDPGGGVANLTCSSKYFDDVFVSKLTSAGNYVWALSLAGNSYDYGNALATAADGSVLVTGYFGGTADFDPGAGTYNLTGSGDDCFVWKLTSAGNLVWAVSMGGSGQDRGEGIAVAADGSVYLTGYFHDTADMDPGSGVYPLTSAGGNDLFVAKLTAAGSLLWARGAGGASYDYSHGLAVASDGSVYTTGYFQGTSDFDPSSGTLNLTSAGDFDAFLVKLRSEVPAIQSLIPSLAAVTEAHVGAATFALTVTFDRAMDTTVAPTISFPVELPTPALTFNVGASGWINSTTYVAKFDVSDTNMTYRNVDVRVAGAKSTAGATQVQVDFADVFTVDLQEPVVTSLTPNLTTIADSNVGTGSFSLTMVYSEAMNTAVAPTVFFPVENPGTTLTFNATASRWTNSTTYVAVYDVADANAVLADIDVRVAGAKDTAGNLQPTWSFANRFSIDMLAPTVLLTSPGRTGNPRPSLVVSASDNGAAVPNGTRAWLDFDQNNDGVFSGSGEVSCALIALNGGTGSFQPIADLPDGSYRARVRVSDAAGNAGTSNVVTLVIDTTPPSNATLTPAAVAENQSVGTLVGTFSTTDTDSSDTFSYALVSGEGDDDNLSFTLDAQGRLWTAASFDRELQPSASILVRVTDAVGHTYDQIVTIEILDVNEMPLASAGGAYTVGEGGTVLLDASATTDPEQAGNSLQYAWDFDGDGVYDDATGMTPSFSAAGLDGPTSVSVGLCVTDAQGLTSLATATVAVQNVAPSVEAGADQSARAGADILFGGAFSDPGRPDTQSIRWDFGDGAFVEGNLAPSHAYQRGGVYTATLTVRDDDGGLATDTVTITVQAAPTVDKIVYFNDSATAEAGFSSSGTGQRSIIRQIQVVFNGQVDLAPGAVPAGSFVLTRQGTTSTIALQVLSSVYDANSQKTTVVLGFSGKSPYVDAAGSLVDGRYQLTFQGDSLGVDADGDGLLGGRRVDQFFRFFGDSNGDGDVDGSDYYAFRQAMAGQGNTALRKLFDVDRDNDVDRDDYTQFHLRYGRVLS